MATRDGMEMTDHVKKVQEVCSGDTSARRWDSRRQEMVKVVGESRDGVYYMRRTPYTDSEGAPIYEGDVLDLEHVDEDCWGPGYVAWFRPHDGWCVFGAGCDADRLSDVRVGKIIGNVYQNPALLEGE